MDCPARTAQLMKANCKHQCQGVIHSSSTTSCLDYTHNIALVEIDMDHFCKRTSLGPAFQPAFALNARPFLLPRHIDGISTRKYFRYKLRSMVLLW